MHEFYDFVASFLIIIIIMETFMEIFNILRKLRCKNKGEIFVANRRYCRVNRNGKSKFISFIRQESTFFYGKAIFISSTCTTFLYLERIRRKKCLRLGQVGMQMHI